MSFNPRPWLGFLWKHGAQLQTIVESGKGPDGHVLVDAATAIAPAMRFLLPRTPLSAIMAAPRRRAPSLPFAPVRP